MAETETVTLSIYDRLTAVRDTPLDSAAKLMLFVLVTYANGEGISWPGNKRLATNLRLSVRQVQRRLLQLETDKIVVARMDGQKRMLQIDWQRLRSLASSGLTKPAKDDMDVMGAKQQTTSTSLKGCHGCHPEHTNELSNSLKRENTVLKDDTEVMSPTATKTQQRLVPDQLDELIAAWNQLPDGIAPRCNKRSTTLVTAWMRANGQPEVQDALSDVAKLMAAIRDSSFLHGKPWFKFSWLFCKSRSGEFNAVKIIEGNYRESNTKPGASAARWQGDADDFAHLATSTPSPAVASTDRELESRSG